MLDADRDSKPGAPSQPDVGRVSTARLTLTRTELDPQNPWPGPEAYGEDASDFFHGRRDEVAEAMRCIRLSTLTALYGKSGLGKTSLLQAGLFPRLRAEHYLPVYVRLGFSSKRGEPPLAQTVRRLREALLKAQAEGPLPDPDESAWEYLHRKDLEIWSQDNFPLVPVLVFDQFEELFSRTVGQSTLVEQVLDDLADLIENRIPQALAEEGAGARRARLDLLSQRYRMVLSFREDFLPDMRAWEKTVPSLLRNFLRLGPMTRERAVEAVERAGREILEPGVAPVIVDFVGKGEGRGDRVDPRAMTIEPVLLSLCCSQLNLRRKGEAKISRTLVETAGQDILDSFYRTALQDPEVKGPPDAAAFIEERLIQGDHYRGDYPAREALVEGLLTEEQLVALTRHRLLRVVEHPDTARIELIHDRLVAVVRRARDERRHRLEQELLQQEAAAQRKRAEEQERASTRLKRALWRTRVLFLATVVATLAALLTTWWVSRLRNLASARALAAAAINQSYNDPELGTLLALEAFDVARSLGGKARREAADSLAQAMAVSHLRDNRRFGQSIEGVAFDPTTGRLLLGLEDATLHLYEWPNVKREIPLQGMDAKFDQWISFGGSRFAAIARQGEKATVRVWNGKNGMMEFEAFPPKEPVGPHLSRDGSLLAVGGWGRAWVWHSGETEPFVTVALPNSQENSNRAFPIQALALHPAGSMLAAGGPDNQIYLWQLPSGNPAGTLQGHLSGIEDLEFNADGSELLSSGRDTSIIVWKMDGTRKRLQLLGHANSVFKVNYSTDGNRIISASADGSARIWATETGQELARLSPHSAPVVWAGFADEDRVALTASWDGTLKTWDASGHTARIAGGVGCRPEGSTVASANIDGTIRLWDAASGEQRDLLVNDSPVSRVIVSPDRKRLAWGDFKGSVKLWDLEKKELTTLGQMSSAITDLDWSPDGKMLVVAASTAGAFLLDVSDPEGRTQLIAGSSSATQNVGISFDGRWIAATTEDGGLWIWDRAQPGAKTPTMSRAHDGQILGLRFSPDSRRILTSGTDHFARLWDLSARKKIAEWQHETLVRSGVFLDSSRVATSSSDGAIVVWNDAGQRLPGPPTVHTGMIKLHTNAAGTRLASLGLDQTARVWDTSTWRELATFTHRGPVEGGCFCASDSRLATYSVADGLRIVPLNPDDLKKWARARVTRRLTREECERFLRDRDCSTFPARAEQRP